MKITKSNIYKMLNLLEQKQAEEEQGFDYIALDSLNNFITVEKIFDWDLGREVFKISVDTPTGRLTRIPKEFYLTRREAVTMIYKLRKYFKHVELSQMASNCSYFTLPKLPTAQI